MGVTEEEATHLYYAEESHYEVTAAVRRLMEQLATNPSTESKRLSKRLDARHYAYVDAFHRLTDEIHEAKVATKRRSSVCPRCRR